MGHKTIKSSFARKLKETQEWLKAIRSQAVLKDWWPILKSKLTGHYNYFGISGNYQSISKFYHTGVSHLRKISCNILILIHLKGIKIA